MVSLKNKVSRPCLSSRETLFRVLAEVQPLSLAGEAKATRLRKENCYKLGYAAIKDEEYGLVLIAGQLSLVLGQGLPTRRKLQRSSALFSGRGTLNSMILQTPLSHGHSKMRCPSMQFRQDSPADKLKMISIRLLE